MTKVGEFRDRSEDQLTDELTKLKKEQFNLRFQRATGQLENTSRVRVIRRDVARLKTIAAQKRAGSMPEIEPKPKAAAKPKVAKAKAEKPKSDKPKSKKPQSAKSLKAGAKKTAAKKSK